MNFFIGSGLLKPLDFYGWDIVGYTALRSDEFACFFGLPSGAGDGDDSAL